jgi:ferredoxin
MSEIVERRLAGVVVRIDRHLCVGFGDCVDEAPESFELDDEGIVAFHGDPETAARERLVRACESCPVDALTLHDDDGTQLAP